MKVIRFPGAAASAAPRQANKKTEQHQHRLLLGPVNFTCASCGSVSEVLTRNKVSRTVEFYCAGCGAFYKLTNPAFSPKK